ncbi:hypothetical protein GCM10027414_17920 [Humibacter ginsengiterrae]
MSHQVEAFRRRRKHRTVAGVAGSAVALGLAVALVIPGVANAAGVVSQSNGQFLSSTLFTQANLAGVAGLAGVTASNTTATGDVIVDSPALDATALQALNVTVGGTDLLAGNGIIQLGAVGQFARANDDGSSFAFSGAVSQAPSLVGVSTAIPESNPIGTPTGTAQIAVGSATSPVGLNVSLGALAAGANETTTGTQTGNYTLGSADITVNGTVVTPIVQSLYTPLQTLITALGVAGVTVPNPLNADGSVKISLADLLAAAGVTSVNDLPEGTNLLSYVPAAVATVLTNDVNGILTQAQNQVTSLGALNPVGVILNTALTTAKGLLNPILSGLNNNLVTPLGTAISGLAALNVNVQTTSNGSFTETAAQLELLGGTVSTINLANATVGPNAGPNAVPIVNPASAGLAGGIALLIGGAWFIAYRARRRTAALPVA